MGGPLIARGVILVAGVLVYLAFLQYGHRIANTELTRLQYLYTTADSQSEASNAGGYLNSPDSSQLGAMSLSK